MLEWLIPSAHAADGGSFIPGLDIFILVAFALVFYFMLWRPQSKRAKEHRELIANLAKGDEIISSGGLVGKITKVEEQFIVFEVSDKVELKLQKSAVTAALPKGTIKSI